MNETYYFKELSIEQSKVLKYQIILMAVNHLHRKWIQFLNCSLGQDTLISIIDVVDIKW